MTAKEKAVELVEKFKPYSSTTNRPDEHSQGFCATLNAKKCALIVVDELISKIEDMEFNYDRDFSDEIKWQERIKTEIQRI